MAAAAGFDSYELPSREVGFAKAEVGLPHALPEPDYVHRSHSLQVTVVRRHKYSGHDITVLRIDRLERFEQARFAFWPSNVGQQVLVENVSHVASCRSSMPRAVLPGRSSPANRRMTVFAQFPSPDALLRPT